MADPHWANVKFLSGFEGASPVDESSLAQTVTLQGSATLSSTSPIVQTKSLDLAATGDCASVPDHVDFTIGETDFTIEGKFRLASVAADRALASHIALTSFGSSSGSDGWMIKLYAGAGVWFEFLNGTFYFGVGSTWIPTVGVDHDICVDFDGVKYRIYADGVMVGSDTPGNLGSAGLGIGNPAQPLLVGAATVSGSPASGMTGKIDEFRLTVGTARYASDGGYTPTVGAFERDVDSDLDDEITDGVAMFAGAGLGDVYNDMLTDTVASTQTLLASTAYPCTASDTVGVSPLLNVVKAQLAALSDTIGMAPAADALRGIVLVEMLRLGMTEITNQNIGLTLDDEVGVEPSLFVGLPAVLTETVGIELAQQVQEALLVIEELGLAPALSPSLLYGRTVVETISLADSLANFFGGDLTDGVGVSEAMSGTALFPGSVSETVGLAAVETPTLALRVTTTEDVGLEDVDALQMLYNPALADGVEFSIGYISPGGNFTTWAMNTRTAAVTEYDNYEFNSFARLGDRYIGASSTGLYELTGDDDQGTNIVAEIKSGFAQWAGTRFTLFKSAYLGVRGEGNFVLKVITGEGAEYNYSVSTRDMRSTKVHMGKGLRARYFAFELISTGQDFDLESIEFVPLVAQRRV